MSFIVRYSGILISKYLMLNTEPVLFSGKCRLVALTGINRVAKNEQSKLWQHWVHKTPSGTPRAFPQVKKRVSDAQDT